MLQYVMPYVPKTAVPINEKLAMDKQNDKICFCTLSGPVYTCEADDKPALRFAQGLLISLKLATAIELSNALGVDRSTVTRNFNIYEIRGMAGFVNNYTSHGPLKLTRSKQVIVKRLLDKGSTITAAAQKVGVTEGCIRAAIKKGHIEKRITPVETPAESVNLKGPSARSQEDAGSKSGVAVKREMERVMASKGLIEEAAPEFAANESVKYAGVLLALPFLMDLNYLAAGKKAYGTLKRGYYGLQSIFLVLAFMALLRMKNPEQIKTSNVGDLGILLGLDRCPEVKTIRRKLNELGLQNQSLQFMESLSRSWMEQDEDITGFVYIDGHVRPYHGRKHTLPKTHVARRRLCMPATTDFWVNGTDCEPLFFVTAPANDSLLSMIDNEIIPGLKQMSGDRRATLIFDREGWSPKQFSKWQKTGIDIMTYRKGRYEPWAEDCFVEVTSLVRKEPVTYKLGERSIRLKKNGWFREVRRLCDNGHQTSVITTRQDLSMEEIARRMFLRWNQENYFKYMREEYGLDHLVSRGVEPADTQRLVPNPQKKALKKEREQKLRQLKTKKEHYATKAADNDEKQCRTMRGFNISNYGLKTQIKRIEGQIKAIEDQIRGLSDKVKIKEVLDKDKIIRLETEKKRLTDAMKMACYRAETQMYEAMGHHAAFAKNLDEGRSFLQRVFQQPADIIPNHDENRLEVRFHTMSTQRENSTLKKICDVVNEEKLSYPGTNLKLVFKAACVALGNA
jgi:transposase-like protein